MGAVSDENVKAQLEIYNPDGGVLQQDGDRTNVDETAQLVYLSVQANPQ